MRCFHFHCHSWRHSYFRLSWPGWVKAYIKLLSRTHILDIYNFENTGYILLILNQFVRFVLNPCYSRSDFEQASNDSFFDIIIDYRDWSIYISNDYCKHSTNEGYALFLSVRYPPFNYNQYLYGRSGYNY